MAIYTGISQCSFTLTSHHARAYQLEMDFTDMAGSSLSKKHVNFTQDRAPVQGRLWDVASINSRCGVPSHFEKRDFESIKAALSQYAEMGGADPIIVTLDIKDSHDLYDSAACPGESISSEEDAVCDFFRATELDLPNSSTRKKIHSLFQSVHPVDFVLREGSLKKDLLQTGLFSDAEADFFQKRGGKAFCQVAEFFMNGLKLGSVARSTAGDFPLYAYVTSLLSVPTSFGPYNESTVLYPPLYQETYSLEGPFFRSLASVYSVSGSLDPKSKITTVNVAAKV